MANGWLKIINNELSVSTSLSGDGEWELFFKGEQGKRELEYNTVVRMWEGDVDSEGVKAKTVHDRAVVLLEAGTTLKKTYLKIQAMVSRLYNQVYS